MKPEKLPVEIDTMWNGMDVSSAFYDDAYIYCTYGYSYLDEYILRIYDLKSYEILYTFDFSNYRYNTEEEEADQYLQQKVTWAIIEDNILYISHRHRTYANLTNNMNAYLTAINLNDMSILWRSNALVSNSENFVIINNTIVSGYGFTDEPDFLYLIDKYTGKVVESIPLKESPDYIIQKGDLLYVRTYNKDYVFEIIGYNSFKII